MNPPRLSLCLIVGDAHVALLPRCLASLLDRPTGPLADEVVIGWNGSDDAAFVAALREVQRLDEGQPTLESVFDAFHDDAFLEVRGVALVVHRGESPLAVGFDVARQKNFERASGVWRGYVDVDDVVPLPDDPAVRASIREGLEAGEAEALAAPQSLMQWLDTLPPHRNLVLAPYDYVRSEKGRPLQRTRRPRIVRWDRYWTWVEGVHERLVHLLQKEWGVYNPGLLFVHEPVIAPEERSDRNFAILKQEVARIAEAKESLPPQVAYGLAEEAFAQADYAAAAAAYRQAAEGTPDAEMRVHYLLRAARAYFETGTLTEAGAVAMKVIETAPLDPHGYLIASEVAFRMKKHRYATDWYEAGGKRQPHKVGAMVDDRIARCMRPVTYAGVAYLVQNRYEEAREVAEIALKESADPAAAKLFQIASDFERQGNLTTKVTDLADALAEQGHLKTAVRLVKAVEAAFPDLAATERELVGKIDRVDPRPWPDQSAAALWLARSGTLDDVKVAVPVDAAEDPAEFLGESMLEVPPTKSLFFATTDPAAGDDYSRSNRIDGLSPETLLATCEEIGEVRSLQLLETNAADRAIGVEVRRIKGSTPWKPDLTFFCPVYAEPWGPWRIWREGTGGSEEAAIYAAREFARQGWNVQVFAPLDQRTYRGVHVEDGVRWRSLESFDPVHRLPGIVIGHRYPLTVGLPAVDPERCFTWHQDAWYNVGWTKPIAQAGGHLFVSEWQQNVLLTEAGLERYRGAVVGNGIPASCLDWSEEGRDPYACAYLSSPLRGLKWLLECWPTVREARPKATLHVFYGWITSQARAEVREPLMRAILGTPGVVWHDRLPQAELERILPEYGVWAYPTCDYFEGFAIAGVRATAAGLVPCYREIGALGEVQHPSTFAIPQAVDPATAKGRDGAAAALIRAIDHSVHLGVDREHYREWARKWLWTGVVDRMITAFRDEGRSSERAQEG